MKLPNPAFRRILGTIPVALLLALAGCQTRIVLPVVPKPDVPPAAATPAGALRRLAWSWKHRAIEPGRDLFTCDYGFAFAPEDTAGRRFVDRPWTRPDELDFALHLFQTGSARARPASYVALDIEDDPPSLPDDRPGKSPRWHQRIETPFVVVIEAPGQEFRVLGIERFYLVRGDSACIPQELRDQGYGPDSTRWWIERWEDYSVSTGMAGAPRSRSQPLRPTTLGSVKSLYLDSPPPTP
jgi:hypothetical protein